jgi:hypothetical protein
MFSIDTTAEDTHYVRTVDSRLILGENTRARDVATELEHDDELIGAGLRVGAFTY